MNMYAQTKVLPCQKGKFEKQDCGLVWLYWNSLKSTAGAQRVNLPHINYRVHYTCYLPCTLAACECPLHTLIPHTLITMYVTHINYRVR